MYAFLTTNKLLYIYKYKSEEFNYTLCNSYFEHFCVQYLLGVLSCSSVNSVMMYNKFPNRYYQHTIKVLYNWFIFWSTLYAYFQVSWGNNMVLALPVLAV